MSKAGTLSTVSDFYTVVLTVYNFGVIFCNK